MKKRGSSRPVRRATTGVSFAPIVEVVCHETETVSYSGIDADLDRPPLSEQHAEMVDTSWQSLGSYSRSSGRRGYNWSTEDTAEFAAEYQLGEQEPRAQCPRQTKQEQLAILNSSWHSTGSVTSSRSTHRLVAISPFVTVMGENNNTVGNIDQDETDQTLTPTTTSQQTPKPTHQPSKHEQLALLNSSWHSTGSATSTRSTPRVVAMSPFVTVMGNRVSRDLEEMQVDDTDEFLANTGDLVDDQERGGMHSPTYQLDAQGGQEDVAASVTRTRASIPFAVPGRLDQRLLLDDASSTEESYEL